MIRYSKITVFFLVCLTAAAISCSRDREVPKALQEQPSDFSALARDIKPAVVNISALEVTGSPYLDLFYHFFGQEPPPDRVERKLGSGVVISRSGLILTSYHLIGQASSIRVTVGEVKTLPGEIVKGDREKDLALIRVKTDLELEPARLGDSRRLEVGEWVMAVGNPFGFENTITIGVISALNREDVSGDIKVGLIQTDASINPGNDGGPLINIKGEVVGVNTAAATEGQGIGFAVPINESRSLFEDFI